MKIFVDVHTLKEHEIKDEWKKQTSMSLHQE